MAIHLQTQIFQFPLISHCAFLTVKLCQYHAAHIQTVAAECVDEAQYVHVVGNAQVAADFVLFNIAGIDDQNDFYVLFHLHQHVDLTIRLKARQYPGSVIVIEKLAAELQIKFAAKLSDSFFDAC